MRLFQFRIGRHWRTTLVGGFALVALISAPAAFVDYMAPPDLLPFWLRILIFCIFSVSTVLAAVLFFPEWLRNHQREQVFLGLRAKYHLTEQPRDLPPKPHIEQFLGGDAGFDRWVLGGTIGTHTLRVADHSVALFLPITFLSEKMELLTDGDLENYVSIDLSYVFFPCPAAQFPWLEIRAEGLLERAKALVGVEDIDFESAAFSDQFAVKSKDRRFAYDIVTPRFMELLLTHPGCSILFAPQGVIVVQRLRYWSPEEFDNAIQIGLAVMNAVPSYVWTRYAAPPPPNPPTVSEAVWPMPPPRPLPTEPRKNS